MGVRRRYSFLPSQSSPIYRVAATGGEAVPVTRLGAGQTSHRFPSFLPGRREFLFYAFGQADMQGIYLASLDWADTIRLTDADTSGMFMAPGWLLLGRQGTLTASRFDLTRRELSGDPVTVATSVAVDTPVPSAAFSASAAGAIAYRTRGTSTSQLTWFDRSGRTLGTLGEPDGAELSNLDLSHDGSRVAAERTLQNDTDVWIVDSSKTTPFASGPGPQRFPMWSVDDTRVMLATRGEFVQKSVGANREEPMAQFKGVLVPTDWSPDGRFVLCVDPNNKETGPDLTLVPTDGGKPIPFVNTRAAETWGQSRQMGTGLRTSPTNRGKTRSSSVRFRPKPIRTGVDLGRHTSTVEPGRQGGVLHRPEWHVDDGAHCRPGRFC